ncbi:MAG: HDOD domain-containing protein [Dissulfurispiraceae bacterium]
MSLKKDGHLEEALVALKMDIPALPVIAAKVLDMLGHELLNAEELADVISYDPAFASRVLKVANSPYFCRGASVSSIDDAVFHVGFEAVFNIVVMSALKDLRKESDAVDFALWEHSTAVAVASRLIAMQLGSGRVGEHFVHGLLHDIGKIVMNMNFKEKYATVIDEVTSTDKSFAEVELSTFGFTHCEIGDYVAKIWRLPVEIRRVISMHTLRSSEIADEAHVFDIILVKAANFICSELEIGIGDDYDNIMADLMVIGLNESPQIDSILEKMKNEYPKYKSLMLNQ